MKMAAQDSSRIEESLARTALKYDLIPYNSKPFSQTHPAKLGGIARTFGLDSVPLAGMRMLELGCAAGGNIIPHAMRFPDASFVGYDISRRQVDEGNARIKQLGLTNIEIRCESITEIGNDAGEFDYIICHGVYSWVPDVVQEAILNICRHNLSPNGIAMVSYNVLPGWRMWQTLRDAFSLMIPSGTDERERVRTARALMDFMKEFSPDKGPYGDVLRSASSRLAVFSDDYIAHEYLEDSNEPCSFRDFITAAGSHELGYLGECDLGTMFPINHGAKFAEAVLQRTTNDALSIEQMIDVMTGRTFRQTLLVRVERMPQVNRHVTPDNLVGLHYLAAPGMTLERSTGGIKLMDGKGRVLTSSSPAVASAFERMLAAFPSSVTLEECAKNFTGPERAQIADGFFRMVISGMASVMSDPITCGKPGNHPAAIPLARMEAAQSCAETANLRHEPITIDPAAMVLLPALDGTRDRKSIEELLFKAASTNRLVFSDKGAPVTDPKALRKLIHDMLPEMLEGLRRSALLEA